MGIDKSKLIRAAAEAGKSSVSPYSRFKVGAALLTKSGKIIPGANVESVSYGLTSCAERVALFKALTDGWKNFTAIAVVARAKDGPMPCGACRQLLAEYAPEAKVFVADICNLKKIREFTVRELLPQAFVSLS
jgi:cytidine deaminase